MRIADVLQSKSIKEVVTISPDAGIRELIAALDEYNIGALIVSADGTALDGIVSERDVVRHLHHAGGALDSSVRTIMTSPDDVATCSPEDSLDSVMQTMTTGRFRHMPVCAGTNLIGIVSIGDLVKLKIDQLQFERDQLDSYVHQG